MCESKMSTIARLRAGSYESYWDTQYSSEWGWYWAQYIKKKAEEKGRIVQVAEMYQNHDLDHDQHKATLDYPEIFDFIDISQNSRKLNQAHWDKLQYIRAYVADHPRPINHTKTYGGHWLVLLKKVE